MQGMPAERHRVLGSGVRAITLLADKRVATQLRLQANLIPASGSQADLDEGGLIERVEDAVIADGLDAARIRGVRLLLNERFAVPDEIVAPGAGFGTWVSVHNRAIHTLRFPALELLLEILLRAGVLREDDEAGGVLIDAMYDEETLAATPGESLRQQTL